jgi:hypothetical protein
VPATFYIASLPFQDAPQIDGLVFAPWISGPARKDHKIVRNFRADAVTLASASGKPSIHAA